MRGVAEFNFPLFYSVAEQLRAAGHFVFSPAERDNKVHGTDISKNNPTGDEALAIREYGFSLREALGADLAWICEFAEGIAVLPGWKKSKGAYAEIMVGQALDLDIREWREFLL